MNTRDDESKQRRFLVNDKNQDINFELEDENGVDENGRYPHGVDLLAGPPKGKK